jgi:hypothetical protein
MEKYDWTRLTHLQIGRFAEYFAKMEFTLFGFDVYQAEVDDKGIDFVIRKGHDRYFDVQVKSVRGFNYIFFPKHCFEIRENLLAAVVIFSPEKLPDIFLIPSVSWLKTDALFASRDYDQPGQKSQPEWGLNLSRKNYGLLAEFQFEKQISYLLNF